MDHFDSHAILFGSFAVFVLLAVGALLVLWIALPFSVFGLKGLVRRSVEEQQETNRLLRAILEKTPSGSKENSKISENKGETL